MRVSLQIHKHDDADDYSAGKRFRFVVVDLNKGKDYPVNFVCLLPMQPNSLGKGFSVFFGIFGDKSLIMAKKLLLEALETETDSEVKREIERRLKLLEPKPVYQVNCDVCGQLFQAQPRKRFKQKFCPECLRKKFDGRA